MQLQTPIPLPPATFQMTHKNPVFSMGSCFAVNIAAKLSEYKFPVKSNPFGIVYNPVSMLHQLQIIFNKKAFDAPQYRNNWWISTSFHSSVNASSPNELTETVENIKKQLQTVIAQTDIFIFTMGTAWVYTLNNRHTVVANCHKIPQKEFTKRLLSVEETAESIIEIKKLIRSVAPQAKFIFTISPVRHIRDGFTQNHQSKAVLHLALRQALTGDDMYFPAYEIMLDELRDYRFFDTDMLHPNTLAIEYIWEKFSQMFFSSFTRETIKKIDKINKGLRHKPFNPGTPSHQDFQQKLQAKIASLPEYIRQRFKIMNYEL